MTIDETWENCLAMWKWIAKQVHRPYTNIADLKAEWAKKNGFDYLRGYCFFCNYVYFNSSSCDNCPGRLVDPNFNCIGTEYDFERHPILFYEKLVSLNRERKRQNRKNR